MQILDRWCCMMEKKMLKNRRKYKQRQDYDGLVARLIETVPSSTASAAETSANIIKDKTSATAAATAAEPVSTIDENVSKKLHKLRNEMQANCKSYDVSLDDIDCMTLNNEHNDDKPGGSFSNVKSKILHCLPTQDIELRIREYLDMLLSSVDIMSRYTTDSIIIIPDVLKQILKFNGVVFHQVVMYEVKIALPLIAFPRIHLDNTEAILKIYINKSMYNEFCCRELNVPIVYVPKTLNIEQFNPLDENRSFATDYSAKIHVAIFCDFLAQFVMSRIDKLASRPSDVSIFENWTRRYITIHSIFDVLCEYHDTTRHESSFSVIHHAPGSNSKFNSLSSNVGDGGGGINSSYDLATPTSINLNLMSGYLPTIQQQQQQQQQLPIIDFDDYSGQEVQEIGQRLNL